MPTIKYESTEAPTARTGYGTGAKAGTLGVRSPDATLDAAYGQSTDPNSGALTTEGKRIAVEASAVAALADYNGENPMFPQYRRNFVPAGGTLTAEYQNPRNKDLSAEEIKTLKLGTAYTPTIASPGVENGVDPNGLRSVRSTATNILANEVDNDGVVTVKEYNPAAPVHSNTSERGTVDNVGTVRKFKLGIGSGAGAEPLSQFPGQPTTSRT
jgi:hypothetical protein